MHRMVQARTRIMNQLQAVALNEGLRCKKRLWREHGREQLESFRLAPWASRPDFIPCAGALQGSLEREWRQTRPLFLSPKFWLACWCLPQYSDARGATQLFRNLKVDRFSEHYGAPCGQHLDRDTSTRSALSPLKRCWVH